MTYLTWFDLHDDIKAGDEAMRPESFPKKTASYGISLRFWILPLGSARKLWRSTFRKTCLVERASRSNEIAATLSFFPHRIKPSKHLAATAGKGHGGAGPSFLDSAEEGSNSYLTKTAPNQN
jgi:hypothetical protein